MMRYDRQYGATVVSKLIVRGFVMVSTNRRATSEARSGASSVSVAELDCGPIVPVEAERGAIARAAQLLKTGDDRPGTLVTANTRHFPAAALDPFRVTAQAPDAFLCNLAEPDPRTMLGIIRRQADDLNAPPLSVSDVLVSLERIVPNFARLMRLAIILESR